MRRKLSATVGVIAAATPALRRQGRCASPTRISLALMTMRLHPARGGAEPSRDALREELLPAHWTGLKTVHLNDAVAIAITTLAIGGQLSSAVPHAVITFAAAHHGATAS